MSFRRIKTLYCLAVIAIGVLLAALGGWIGWIAAVLVLGGALPMFRVIGQQSEQNTKRQTLQELTVDLIAPGHLDTPESDLSTQDHLTSQQSA